MSQTEKNYLLFLQIKIWKFLIIKSCITMVISYMSLTYKYLHRFLRGFIRLPNTI